jgi:hypothetical protein
MWGSVGANKNRGARPRFLFAATLTNQRLRGAGKSVQTPS